MKERLMKIRSDLSGYWTSRTKAQKGTLIGTLAGVVVLAALITFFATRTNFVPLYTDVSRSEIGKIKETFFCIIFWVKICVKIIPKIEKNTTQV